MTSRLSRALAAATTVVLACACVHQPSSLVPGVAKLAPRPSGGLFDYAPAPLDVKLGPVETRNGYRMVRATFPPYFAPADEKRILAVNAYTLDAPGVRPSIALFPILGGDYSETKMVAEFLVEHGYNVLRFERKAAFLAPGSASETQREIIREIVIDARRGLDWWLAQPGIDAGRVGVVGISMGGIYATLLMAADPRVRAGVFVITGGNIADLIAQVHEEEVEDFRAPLLLQGMTLDALAREAHRQFDDIDPVAHAGAIDPARALMVTAIFDKVVPRPNSDALYRAMNRPRRVLIPTGHYTSVLFLGVIEKEMLAHFARVLGPS